MGKFIVLTTVIVLLAAMVMAGVNVLLASPSFMFALIVATIPVVLVVAFGVVLCGAFVTKYILDIKKNNLLVAPNENGLLPIPLKFVLDPMYAHKIIDVHNTKATMIPSSIHYAPKYTNIKPELTDTLAIEPITKEVETFWQLFQGNKLPLKGFLMGYDLDDGLAVFADWIDLYSSLLGGKSGMGKTTLIRSILAQSAMQGGRFVIIDPHYHSGDDSLGSSIQPLRNFMLCDVAVKEDEILDALKYVLMIGRRRISGEDKDKTPIILVTDETTALLQRSNVAQVLTTVLGEISQETRKVGVYALCIGQNFHGKILDTTVRDSFVSMLTMRTNRKTAATQSGNNDFGKMAETLTLGQTVWMNLNGDMQRLAVPNCTQADLELVASHLSDKNTQNDQILSITPVNSGSVSGSVSGSLVVPASDTDNFVTVSNRAARVRDMLRDNKNLASIIKEVWEVEGKGRAYQQATTEFYEVLKSLL